MNERTNVRGGGSTRRSVNKQQQQRDGDRDRQEMGRKKIVEGGGPLNRGQLVLLLILLPCTVCLCLLAMLAMLAMLSRGGETVTVVFVVLERRKQRPVPMYLESVYVTLLQSQN